MGMLFLFCTHAKDRGGGHLALQTYLHPTKQAVSKQTPQLALEVVLVE